MKMIIIVGAFNCKSCGKLERINQIGEKTLKAPLFCSNCGAKSWILNITQSEWVTEENEFWGEILEGLKQTK